MKRQLPPLQALRVFEAAGRHLNFSRAAEELHVTQGAVSRQVKVLETYLGKPLFVRLARNVAFTPFGQDTHASIVRGMDIMETALQPPRRHRRELLRISTPQSLGNLWLMPRLSAFSAAHPHIDVSVVSSMDPADFSHDDYDVAIRLGRLPGRSYPRNRPRIPHQLALGWEGICAEHLWDEVLTPVASPVLLQGIPALQTPQDLLDCRLLHVSPRADAWSDWFRSQNTPYKAQHTMTFGHFFMAMEAARRGMGVALAPTLLLDDDSGLVCPFTSTVKSAGAYYLLYRESRAEDRAVRAFQAWLQQQGQADAGPRSQEWIAPHATA